MMKKVLLFLIAALVSGALLVMLLLGAGAALLAPWTAAAQPAEPAQPALLSGTPTGTPFAAGDESASNGGLDAACTEPIAVTADAGGRVSYQGISFTLPAELGGRVAAWECPTADIDPNDFMRSQPAYVAFRFFTEREQTAWQPELHFYRVEGDMRAYRYPLNALDELRSILDQRPEQAESWFKAPLKVHTGVVPFAAGQGIRGVVIYAQDYFFFINNDLLYDFHGLTDDGRYYVRMHFPIAAPFLMDLKNGDPRTNSNLQAIPVPAWTDDFEAIQTAIGEYNSEALRRLNVLEDDGFTPNLRLMDGLIESIRIE